MASAPIILHYLHRDNFGGGPKNVLQVIGALDGMGEQHVVTSGFGRLTQQVKSRSDLGLHHVSDVSPALFPMTVWQLRSLLTQLRPALVLTHGQWGGMFMGMALGRDSRTKAVFVTQWCSLYESRDPWRAARNWVAEWLAFSRHQRIICASEGNVRQFLYAGLLDDRSRVSVIPNPVDSSATAAPEVVARLVPPVRIGGIKTFVFLGRLERQKRPDWLLKAWKMALDRGMKNARLLVMGEGRWRGRCEELIREHLLSDTVQVLGHRTDATSYLQNADGLLLTSLYEGHANVVLEAMACGVPVIAMAADGVAETFEDGEEGFMVTLGNIPRFAERLVTLSGNVSLWQQMSHKAVLRAKGYSAGSHRDAFREAIGGMLAGNLTEES